MTKTQRAILEHLANGGTVERSPASYSGTMYDFFPARRVNSVRKSTLEAMRTKGWLTVGFLPGRASSLFIITEAGKAALSE